MSRTGSSISTVQINNQQVCLNGETVYQAMPLVADDVYRSLDVKYLKFFKMDVLCKWATIAAELLLKTATGYRYQSLDPTKIAMVVMTNNGCIDVDTKYLETTHGLPSPALFVYTLPNIMLGELSIKHGFKGEQLVLIDSKFNKEMIEFWVQDLLQHRGMDACLAGWIDAYEQHVEVAFEWIVKGE